MTLIETFLLVGWFPPVPSANFSATKYEKVGGLLLGVWFGYIDTLELINKEGSELGSPNEKILGTKLGALYGLELGKFNGKELG